MTEPDMCIIALGDLSFRGRREASPDLIPFGQVHPILDRHDLVVANLESPLATEARASAAERKVEGGTVTGMADQERNRTGN